MNFSPLLDEFITALRCLPGVGPKSAQRIAFSLLQQHKEQGLQLAHIMQRALNTIQHCQQCRTFSEKPLCDLCTNPKRQADILCIVESPIDILMFEQTSQFHGHYFVLLGHLSPLDGIGPADLGIDVLLPRLQSNTLSEIIIATNPTVEGEATAHYLLQVIRPFHIKTSRLAHGVPMGGELEYIDNYTLTHALLARKEMV
ncbi:MAG: recombination mediator RecR [Legionellales bacterium]|nr:recombination mediator RecR [Legionellales bacterium]